MPEKAIIEMKSRGKDLHSHVLQAREYWNNSYGKEKTPYVVLCNFDEIMIFNWFMQDAPLDKFNINDLENRWRALAFLSKEPIVPIFANNVEKATKEAVEQLLNVYHSLINRGEEKNKVQKFVLQLLVCFFSEDAGLFPVDGFFLDLIRDCKNTQSAYDLFPALFRQMNNKNKAKGGRFKNVPYFNGGLFKEIDPVDLTDYEIALIEKTATFNWRHVEPAIFGNIFEYSMDSDAQHAMGAHYTYEKDIMKIIRPTIIQPILEEIKKANTLEKLRKIRAGLGQLKILDPACGSGNFLYVALRELKNLELEILSKINENFKSYNIRDVDSVIQTKQFYGMDINPFAVELAKVTLSFGKKIFNGMFSEYIKKNQLSLEFVDKTLPFDDLDRNIVVKDALFNEWPKADIIIGNPPFLGGKYLRTERGDDYAEKIYKAFPDAKGQPDLCVFWFQKANDSSAERIGLVGTNSISQGVSRKASLDYISANNGTIISAVSTQVWSGTANVHVSLVNWVKNKKIIPSDIFLDEQKVNFINSSLKAEADYTVAKPLKENENLSFQACELSGKGFIVSAATAKEWIKKDKKNKEVLKPMLDGKTLVSPGIELDWVIDFNDMTLEKASGYKVPFEHVKQNIRPERMLNKEKSRSEKWWLFGRSRPQMRKAFKGLECYFCLPKVAKYTCFRPIDVSVLPCEANMVVASDDFFILGILNSKIHMDWVLAQCSTLKSDTRYTNTTCFLTFPFPHEAKDALKQKVREIMKELEDFRSQEAISRNCTITKLYNDFFSEPSSNLFKLHKKLDKTVCACYGWKHIDNKVYNDEVLELNEKKL
nr:DNA methyltransferase [Desulforegula conservatrix]